MASREAESDVAGDCIIEATVPSDFETTAAEEVEEIFLTDSTAVRGRIMFQTPIRKAKDILTLGGVDHCRVQILHVPCFGFSSDPEDCLSRLQLLVKKGQWRLGLDVWRLFQPDAFRTTDAALQLPNTMPEDEDLIAVSYSARMSVPPSSHVSGVKLEPTGERPVADPSDAALHSHHAACQVIDVHDADHPGDNFRHRCGSRGNSGRKMADELDAQHQDLTERRILCIKDSTETSTTKDVDHAALVSKSCPMSREAPESSVDSVYEVTQPVKHTTKSAHNRKDSGHRRCHEPDKLSFRVTCNRTGENHCFDSMSAAASFGHAVQTAFGWQVDLKHFDVEVVLHISDEDVSVGIALTPDSLHRRDLVAFGITTLRSTIAYNMLRMAHIQPGQVVCDPLCGTSSIPIQGALRFHALQLAGDYHGVAMEKTLCNISTLNRRQATHGKGGLMMDALRWNACCLPLRDKVVDAFVSDLPFGKRVGRRSENLKLYSGVLKEMSRCSKPTGRAVLLTADIKNMMKALKAQKHWSLFHRRNCSIGGLAAAVFLLRRASLSYQVESYPASERREKG